jgi:hypothetical protein
MLEANLTDFHYAYVDLIRHWNNESEQYTGGDALFTALSNGWEIDSTVRYEDCWLLGGRYVVVYYFNLKREDKTATMPVVTNPYVRRFISSMSARLVAMGDKKIKPAVQR